MAKYPEILSRAASFWNAFRAYFGGRRWGRREALVERDGLARFLDTRASYVAQVSLYGYLRTRAGTRYPQLFANDEFAKAIDLAKWQLWLA